MSPATPSEEGLPVIDVAPLVAGGPAGAGAGEVAAAIDRACRRDGFFIVVGHGVDPTLQERMDRAARAFFALPDDTKSRVAMERGGRAWRGWFPVGGELTSGAPDRKEGLYFGAELPADHPKVQAGLPLHGPNLWPEHPPALRSAVTAWMAAMESLGQALLSGMAVGLGLEPDWFRHHLTADPTVLFRIFRYPGDEAAATWGVGEHTDYGLLTLLAQDDLGGLEVRTGGGWRTVPVVPGAVVCNLGDMVDAMTGGRYRSTPHRVRTPGAGERLSFPFFLDPSWDAAVAAIPLPGDPLPDDAAERWDGTSLRDLRGTYGGYLTAKVAKVFPGLGDAVLGEGPGLSPSAADA